MAECEASQGSEAPLMSQPEVAPPPQPQSEAQSQARSQPQPQSQAPSQPPAKTKRKTAPASVVAFGEQFFEATDKVVPIGKLKWDLQCKEGQVRRLQSDRVGELVKSLLSNVPIRPIHLIVWNRADGKFTILAGQHIMAAVQVVHETQRAKNMTLHAWMTHAECDVVRFDVTRSTRERIAGRHNATQHDVSQLKFWQHMELILRELENDDEDGLQACTLAAVEKAGVVTKGQTNVCCSCHCRFSTTLVF
jgi:hypothetical protein